MLADPEDGRNVRVDGSAVGCQIHGVVVSHTR
jgi:hypothetical protein